MARRLQPWPIRITHWLNVWFLVVMAGSGLQILAAFPSFGPRGEPYGWYPFHGTMPPAWLTIGDWLAGGRHWHFAFAALFTATGIAWVAYLALSGEWRRRLFLPRRDLRDALETAAYYLRLGPKPPERGLYNGLQRAAYTSTIVAGAVVVITGLVLFKPVQLGLLTAVVGGYDAARAIHFLALVYLSVFSLGHLLLVLLHPRALVTIFTGGPKA